MRRNSWRRIWRGPEAPLIYGFGGGVLTCLVLLVADTAREQAITVGGLTGILVLALLVTCLRALSRASQRETGTAQDVFRQSRTATSTSRAAANDRAPAERQQMEAEIRCGLINGEFDVAYQPICNAATHEIEAVEALVRWPRRPDGELGPDAFIGAADSTGIIHRLGLFVLQRACSDMADIDHVRLHVNISPVQFHHPEFELQITSILDETGFPAARLELEITERHILQNPDRARAIIASLSARGVGFALDDFGAGVSGIGHLQRFGLRRVKIDRDLIATIGRDPQAGMLLTGAVSIAHALSLGVVAEGVETEDQEKLLRLVGCDLLQGYRFGRPSYFADMAERLSQGVKTAHLN